jgi:hypothetical protein
MDAAGNLFIADTGNNRICEIAAGVLATVNPVLTFTLATPGTQNVVAGQNVTIPWTAGGWLSGHNPTITLGYDTDTAGFDANQHWIAVSVNTADGADSFTWNTANVPAGTYYLDGYLYDPATDQTVYSTLSTPIVVTPGAATPTTFTLTGPSGETFVNGQIATFRWTAGGVVAGDNTTISLGVDTTPTPFNGNQYWIETGNVAAANGAGSYSVYIDNATPGTYYVEGYLHDATTNQTVYSNLGVPFTIMGSTTTTVTSSTSGSSVYGQPVTFTATVNSDSGTPDSGTVTFMDGTTVLGSTTLNGSNVAMLSVSTLPLGLHTITANYGGNSDYAAGTTTAAGTNSLVTTVAGDGTTGYAGDGGPATAASLNNPVGVAVDAAGDLFIADRGNSVIRDIVQATGNIITVAGNGTSGYTGDGGPATAASLNNPTGVAVDAAGDLFIADRGNNVIREVVHATGKIITVAGNGTSGYTGDGGPATAASFNDPTGVAVDAVGDLFIADMGNNVIREVVQANGNIITVAGNGTSGYTGDGGPATAASLNNPVGVAVDAAGDLVIADAGNNVVREVDAASGNIVTNQNVVAISEIGQSLGGTTMMTHEVVPPSAAIDAAGDVFFTIGTANYVDPGNVVREAVAGAPLMVTPADITVTGSAVEPDVTVSDPSGPYTGSPYAATGTVTGLGGVDLGSPTFSYYAGDNADGTPMTTVPIAAGTYTVVASFAGGNGYLAAQSNPLTFTITSSVSATIGTEILGAGQPGFWSNAAWTASTQGLDGGSLVSSTADGSKASQAAWWFSMPAGTYDIAITYTAAANLTTHLALDLYDGVGHWIGQVEVNEQVAPADFFDQGVGWKRLGSFTLTNNIFHISTWNSATDGAICIDAIELRAVPMVSSSDATGIKSAGTFLSTGTWTTAASGAFGSSRVSSSAAGSGSSTATWSLPVAPGNYEVDATWTPSASLSANVTYNIYDGTTLLKSVSVDQQNAPSGVTDEGINWTTLGDFTITTQLTVTVANTAGDGQVCADTVRLRPDYQPTEIINNGSPGFWSGGPWTTNSAGLFGDSLVSSSANGSKTSQAAWWFPCRPGLYDVQVTWQPGSNLSTNVSFDVYNALTYLSSGVVNEQNAPNGAMDHGVSWQSLGIFTMTSNVLDVLIWNSPTDGAICIDGIRIIPVDTLMAEGTSAADAAPALLKSSQLQPIVAAAEARWAAAGVSPVLIDRLKQMQIVVANLPAGYLGLTEGNEILLSPNAAGLGWFVDPTPDEDEEFSPTAAPMQLQAVDSRAVDSIDLLTVVEHEMGHVLGMGDLDGSLDLLMSDRLGAGVRRIP